MLLKIGAVDFTSYVKSGGITVSYETLLSSQSGRNARGDNVIDIIAKKIKLVVTFIPLNDVKMATLLTAIDPLTFNITYLDPKTNAEKTITIYTGSPSVKIYIPKLFEQFDLSFIEM